MTKATTKRGRPRNLQRREAILEAAVILAGKQGFQGTTMAEVARAAGISTPLLFRYFKSRAVLLDAICKQSDRHLKWLIDGIVQAARTSSTCADLLFSVGHVYAEYIGRMHHYYVLWFMNKDLMPERTRRLFDSLYPTLARKLASMPDYRKRAEPEVVIRAFLGAVFFTAFLGERIGAAIPRGVSFDDYLRTVANYAG
jgi:AcrR family transcriptional regulator